MLSYDDALVRILAAAGDPLPAEPVVLAQALGRALATDLVAPADLPAFANSAVDGFAVRQSDTVGASPDRPIVLPITQTIPAGHAPERALAPGEAAGIFTGAPLPPGADALVMVEDTQTEGDADTNARVRLFAPGAPGFVRAAGSDIAQGTLALRAGTTLDAGAIGLLAALNVSLLVCARRPRAGLITTGDEVIAPGGAGALAPGQIRDANGPALEAALAEAGADVAVRRHARDSEADVHAALDACADAGCDLVLASGGVSVGDYDVVKTVISARGALDFWRIAIRPGKPLAFGRTEAGALFFGLPGNPASSLVTFELFVRPVLRRLAGHANVFRPQVSAVLASALPHEPGRREFARARLDWRNDTYHAAPLGAQTSHRLLSLAGADALLVLSEKRGDYPAGERVPALLI